MEFFTGKEEEIPNTDILDSLLFDTLHSYSCRTKYIYITYGGISNSYHTPLSAISDLQANKPSWRLNDNQESSQSQS